MFDIGGTFTDTQTLTRAFELGGKMKQVELDPFTAEILREYLITTVEELDQPLALSAHPILQLLPMDI